MEEVSGRSRTVLPGAASRIAIVILFLSIAVADICAGESRAWSPPNAVTISLLGPMGMGTLAVQIFAVDELRFPTVGVTYCRTIADHLILSASLSYLHLPAHDGPDSGGDFFTPWVEIDWHPRTYGLDGFFIGLATAAEADYFWGDSPMYLFDGFGATIGRRATVWRNIIITLEFGGVTNWLFDSDSWTFAEMLQLGLGFSF